MNLPPKKKMKMAADVGRLVVGTPLCQRHLGRCPLTLMPVPPSPLLQRRRKQ